MARKSSADVIPLPGPRPSIRQVCLFIGCDPSTFSKYVRVGLLSRVKGEGCDERTAVELGVLWRLVQALKAEQGHRAWNKVRSPLRRLWSADYLDVIWEPNSGRATLVTDPAAGYSIAQRAGLVHVVTLCDHLADIRTMWKDVALQVVVYERASTAIEGRTRRRRRRHVSKGDRLDTQ